MVLGGTFDILHPGHKALLKKAFSLGQVTIGLTSDEMARRSRKREVNKFSERKKALAGFIKNAFGEKARIFKLNDKYGSAPGKDFDYIIVSPATFKTALEINKIRKKITIFGRDKGENKLIKIIKQIHKRVAKTVKRKLILDLESGIFLNLRGIF